MTDQPPFQISNNSATAVSVDFSINGNDLLTNTNQIIAEIEATPAAQTQGFPFAAWQWLMSNSYHWTPVSDGSWQDAPYLYLDSLGWGYCSDVASVFYYIVSAAGYTARVWSLDGHVVPEVLNNGSWQIYDPDLQAIYVTSTGQIAGYDQIVAGGQNWTINLANSIYASDVSAFAATTAYNSSVLNLYTTTSDNQYSNSGAGNQGPAPASGTQEPYLYNLPLNFGGSPSVPIILPPNSSLNVEDYDNQYVSLYGYVVPNAELLNVNFGALSNFTFQYPLIPIAIIGAGDVTIDGVDYVIGSTALTARLGDTDDPIYAVTVDTTGSNNVISYLLNATRFDVDDITSEAVQLTAGPGADTLQAGAGNYTLTINAGSTPNASAGSVIQGGDGNDTIVFNGSQAYTSNYVTIDGGQGDDLIEVATAPGQYAGSIQIQGGAGDDTIKVGHIEGSTGGLGYIHGGDGTNFIEIVDTWNGVAIWSNSAFQIDGGPGDDTFQIDGTVLDVLGNGQGAAINGGGGFNTLNWNGEYNLTVGGEENPAVGLYAGYVQQIAVSDIEQIDVTTTGQSLDFTPQDVAAITAGSDFDQSTLGLGLTGTGNTLFVELNGNQIDVAGWTDLGAATVGGVAYEIFQDGSEYLGLPGVTQQSITDGPGLDTLQAGAGNYTLTINAGSTPNASAGSVMQGGSGNDTIVFNGSQAYTSNYVTIDGGQGDDLIEVATAPGQYAGSIQIQGGAGDDTIKVGHIEGSTGGLGYIHGGAGTNFIEVVDTWNGVAIWSNSAFQIDGGPGDDTFQLDGTVLDVLGNGQGAAINGGGGFNTLNWNGEYNLTVGGEENPAVGLYAGYVQQIAVSDIEQIDVTATGQSLDFTPQDVAAITAGSDFDQSTLGLGLAGTGNTLFVELNSNDINLTGWSDIGQTTLNGLQYEVFKSSGATALLAVNSTQGFS